MWAALKCVWSHYQTHLKLGNWAAKEKKRLLPLADLTCSETSMWMLAPPRKTAEQHNYLSKIELHLSKLSTKMKVRVLRGYQYF
jgi:hypothetical protein